ncbi:isochorismatase family cysteine hydrolase [Niallia sp. 03133]|uniref:isochorismatase family cysteine hydrolase n=1 Tax=Niallia sp. 03133 TaxID=3458060 RepID=UPI004043A9A7
MKKHNHAALLIIDMINDFNFTYGNTLAAKTLEIATNIYSLKQKCTKEKIPVIYINDHYNLWKADLEKILSFCQNDKNNEILQRIKPTDRDYFLIKPKHSAFYGTALHTLLQQLNVDTLLLAGIAGNICVLFTANDAYMREYSLIVPENCIASVDNEDNLYAIRMMKNVMDAKIFTYQENTIMSTLFPS